MSVVKQDKYYCLELFCKNDDITKSLLPSPILWLCSEVTPEAVLKDHPWQDLVTQGKTGSQTWGICVQEKYATCYIIIAPAQITKKKDYQLTVEGGEKLCNTVFGILGTAHSGYPPFLPPFLYLASLEGEAASDPDPKYIQSLCGRVCLEVNKKHICFQNIVKKLVNGCYLTGENIISSKVLIS